MVRTVAHWPRSGGNNAALGVTTRSSRPFWRAIEAAQSRHLADFIGSDRTCTRPRLNRGTLSNLYQEVSMSHVAKKGSTGFTAEERAAMRERAKELKAEAHAHKNRADGERDVLAAIAAMPHEDRVLAERLHEIIVERAPVLVPKTWYGMPAYALDG